MNALLLSLLLFLWGGFCLLGMVPQASAQAQATAQSAPDLSEAGLRQLALETWQALRANDILALTKHFPSPRDVREFAQDLDQFRPGFSMSEAADEATRHFLDQIANLPDNLSYFYETSPPDSLIQSLKPELVHLEEAENGMHTAKVYLLFGRAFDNTEFANMFLNVHALRMPAGWKLISLPEWHKLGEE